MLLSPLSWSVLLADAKGERRHVLTDLCCLLPTDFTSSQSPISKGLVTPSSEQTYDGCCHIQFSIKRYILSEVLVCSIGNYFYDL